LTFVMRNAFNLALFWTTVSWELGRENAKLFLNREIQCGNSSTLRTVRKADGAHEIRKWSLHMTIGMLFYVIAAIVFFLGGIGATVIPNHVTWGLFCIAMGLAMDDVGFGAFRRR
jgi:hypothetical protein